jgi:hypothetical protein
MTFVINVRNYIVIAKIRNKYFGLKSKNYIYCSVLKKSIEAFCREIDIKISTQNLTVSRSLC